MSKSNKILLIVIGLLIILTIFVVAIVLVKNNETTTNKTVINSYDDCVAAGFPVAESFPEQCITSDGRSFTNPNPQGPGAAQTVPAFGEIPVAVQNARAELAQQLSINEDSIIVLEALEKDWPDTCLGLAVTAEICADAITPGYNVLLLANSKEYRYRTNATGTEIRLESATDSDIQDAII